MKIIGAGLGRTGTLSLKAALERLGFGPCFHMSEMFGHQERMHHFLAAARGEPVDWEAAFAGFESTVDWPGCAFWRPLAARYPDAKVLLSVRDPQRWYTSVRNTIHRASTASPPPEAGELPAELVRHRAFVDEIVWQGHFAGRATDEEFAVRTFIEHNEAVQREIPADRLLVHRVSDGWAPLCDFLGVAVPDEPFPHLNDEESFHRTIAERIASLRQ